MRLLYQMNWVWVSWPSLSLQYSFFRLLAYQEIKLIVAVHSSGIYLANKTIWPLSLMLEKCLDRLQSKTCAVHAGFIVLLWDLIYHLWTLPTVVKGTFIKYFFKNSVYQGRESKKPRQFIAKVNSVQEAFTKFFAVHTLKFEILQPA